MSSNYFYKNISLSNIYENSGNSTPSSPSPFDSFVGIPVGSSTIYTAEQPNTFGFSYQSIDLTNYVTANNTGLVNTTGNYTIPTGCKSVRVISVGGGGGAGGEGGYAKCTAYDNAEESNPGGPGCSGGYAEYNISNISTGNSTTLSVFIGNAGTGGTIGDSDAVKSNFNGLNYNNEKCNNQKAGNDGTAGNSTYITFDANGPTQYAIALGGNGGQGGNAAKGNVEENKFNDTNPGNSNAPTGLGNAVNSQYSGAPNYYPQLGNGGHPGVNSATTGQNGAAQIIWLFD